jgi:hypothetical protein
MAVSVSTPGRAQGRGGNSVLDVRPSALVRVTMDNSYQASGEPLDLKQYVGFTPATVFCTMAGTGNTAWVARYDISAKLIRLFSTAAGAGGFTEVSSTTDVSACVVDLLVLGD